MPLTAATRPVGSPPPMITIETLRAAARVLEGVAVRTPLLDVPDLSARLGLPVALKCELLQPSRSGARITPCRVSSPEVGRAEW
jgi:threonine dehydratase